MWISSLKWFFLLVVLIPGKVDAAALASDDRVLRIIVADDVPSNRKLLIRQLQRSFKAQSRCRFSTIEILEAEKGSDVVNQIKEHTVHAIVLDGVMPGSSGIDALREINKWYSGYIVAWSGTDTYQTEMMDLGAHSPLPKPNDHADAKSLLQDILDHAESMS